MARVRLERLGKVYPNGVEALSWFHVEARDGELLVLVGPSGCGKTTTLRMIAGLEPVTSGTIYIGDRAVNDLPPKDRDVAMVFQDHALYPHMTAYGNMAFSLRLRKVPATRIDQKVREAAAMLGIEPLLDRKPRQLSGGQRQRVALGRAIVRNPACFLFDEPLSSLDARLRLEMRAELKRLCKRLGTTTIYVTHDQQEAMTLGDRIVVMREGRIQQTGAPLEIFNCPTNRFVAGFFGDLPMNFLEGTIESHQGRLWFNEGNQRLAMPGWAVNMLAGDMADMIGAPVVLGIRPEIISPRPIDKQTDNALKVDLVGTELLGDKIDVHLSTEHHPAIVARFQAGSQLDPQAIRQVYVDLDRVHFFAPGDGAVASMNLRLLAALRAVSGD